MFTLVASLGSKIITGVVEWTNVSQLALPIEFDNFFHSLQIANKYMIAMITKVKEKINALMDSTKCLGDLCTI